MKKTNQPSFAVVRPLDWTTAFSEGQWEALQERYASGHSAGMTSIEDLDKFVLFAHDIAPDALKRYRLWVDTVAFGRGLESPFIGAGGMCMLHYYCILRYPMGIRYELNATRVRGLKRVEAADTIALAWLHGGPFGMNIAAQMAYEYMKDWDPKDDGPGFPWPAGWSVDPEAFASGIDLTEGGERNEISKGDLEKIEDWHRRVEGEVPAYVPFLAENYPLALRVFRARFETTTQRSLPKQFIALCWLQLAGLWHRPDALRRAIHMCRVFGVEKDQAIHVLSLNHVYQGHVGMSASVEGAIELLRDWKQG